MGVLLELPTGLLAAQPPSLHYVGYATPHSQTKVVFFIFIFFTLPWHSHPDKGQSSPLPTPITCI